MEKQLHLIVFVIAVLAMSVAARAQSNPSQSTTLEPTTVQLSVEEARFLDLINAFRVRLGLNELKVHAGLQVAAQKHSEWMAAEDRSTGNVALSHFGPTPTTKFADRIVREGYAQYTIIGENVACGSDSAVGTFKQFALSPSHLQNMMSPRFRHLGIARAGNGSELCPFYWTNDFGSKARPSTDLPGVPLTEISRIAAAIDAVSGPENDNGFSTEQILRAKLQSLSEKKISLLCTIPYRLGQGVLATAPNTQTTIEVTDKAGLYMIRVSYQQLNSSVQYTSYSVSGVSVLKNPYYPLITVFSAPATRFGGFIIQVDTATGRAHFDPYPGQGGMSGSIQCELR